jgi:hypothetical protein
LQMKRKSPCRRLDHNTFHHEMQHQNEIGDGRRGRCQIQRWLNSLEAKVEIRWRQVRSHRRWSKHDHLLQRNFNLGVVGQIKREMV